MIRMETKGSLRRSGEGGRVARGEEEVCETWLSPPVPNKITLIPSRPEGPYRGTPKGSDFGEGIGHFKEKSSFHDAIFIVLFFL